MAFPGYQRVFAGERRRHELGVGSDHLLRVRAGQRRDEARCFYFQSRWHFFLQEENQVRVNQKRWGKESRREKLGIGFGRFPNRLLRTKLSQRRRGLAAERPAGSNPGGTGSEF